MALVHPINMVCSGLRKGVTVGAVHSGSYVVSCMFAAIISTVKLYHCTYLLKYGSL